jgi:hypothetical protein
MTTGAQVDNLGRLTQVWAIPDDSALLVSWGYDPAGRVIAEGGTRFLLDGEGLRFKRVRAGGAITYTVYGFGREPLMVLERPAPPAPSGPMGGF